ncbi:MAG: type II toxin-antitoxin system death-on-curing family toxin [Verrucomicrobiota bacterium]
MKEPVFLTVQQIEELHDDSITSFGGTFGVRDRSGLESAAFHPQNVYLYAGGDLYEIAAAYAFHLAESQAFVDGNKRTAASAALAFLEGNGIETNQATNLLEQSMLGIANKSVTKTDLASLLRRLFPR